MATTNGSEADTRAGNRASEPVPADPPPVQREGPGRAPVGGVGVTVVGAYFTVVSFVVLYALVQFWPYPTPAMLPADDPPGADTTAAPAATDSVTLALPGAGDNGAGAGSAEDSVRIPSAATASDVFVPVWLQCEPQLIPYYTRLDDEDKQNVPKCVDFWPTDGFALWDEQRLLLIVLLAGALGSIVHGLRSMTMYVGNRQLRWSWMAYYAVLPFSGATTALVFYLVIRGGFFSPTSDFSQTSPFGFAAFAAIVGLFSQNAILKLQKIAETIFEPNEQQSDSLAASGAPSIAKVVRKPTVEGGREDLVEITGANFSKNAQLLVNDKPRSGEWKSATLMHLALTEADLAVLENGGTLSIVVVNSGDARSGAAELDE